MPHSKLWLLNSDGKVFTLSHHSRHIEELGCAGQSEFKRLAAVPQCTWALGSDHQLYIFVPSSDIPIRVQESTCENERWVPGVGWSGKTIFPKARRNWSDLRGYGYHPKDSFTLPTSNWKWEGEWQVDENMGGEVSGLVGWQYAVNWLGTFSAQMSWNSYVRRRKWVRYRRYIHTDCWAQVPTLGEEMADHQEPFLDVSVGGHDLPTQLEGQLCVWAVSITGQVYVREGVCLECPEGTTWRCIQTGDTDSGVIEASVSPTGQVWAVTWDGRVMVRVGISCDMIYGSDWVVAPYPSGHPILQVAVGSDTVWALSREGKIWFWKEREVIEGSQSTGCGNWIEMVGEMALLSVGANNQVFAIGLNDTSVYLRTSVSPDLLTGKTWQALTILEPNSRQSRGSFDSSFSSYSGRRSWLGMESTSSTLNENNISKTSRDMLPTGQKFAKENNTSHNIVLNNNRNNASIIPLTQDLQDGVHAKVIESLSNQSDKSVIETIAQEDNSAVSDTDPKSPNDQTDANTMEYSACINTPVNCEPGDKIEEPVVSNFTVDGDKVDGINFDSLNSNISEVVDFVTDLLEEEEKSGIYTQEVACNFVTDLLEENSRNGPDLKISITDTASDDLKSYINDEYIPCTKQGLADTENPCCEFFSTAKSSLGEDVCDKPSFYIEQENSVNNKLDIPSGEGSRFNSCKSFLDSERSVSALEVNMNWIWLSAAACSLDTTSMLPWIQSQSDIASEGKEQIDPDIRHTIFERLKCRNKAMRRFSRYEDAVEKTVWMKRGQLQLLVDQRRQASWVDCVLELEQGLSTNISCNSLLFLHYTLGGKQMHSQICLSDVVCVCRMTDNGNKSSFAIFMPDGVEAKRRPYTLCTASEKETIDWISSIAVACCSTHGGMGPVGQSAVWSVTYAGDVLVHQPPTPHPAPLSQMHWCQLGGHMKSVETNTQGITWAIGYDNTAYVYSGGFGGGIFKAIPGTSEDVYPQSDVRQMYIYENQKWQILTGFSSRYLLSHKYAWTDESGKIPMTKNSIKLPSSNWQWLADWAVDFSTPGGVDADGWQYAAAYQRIRAFHGHKGWGDIYRKRRWVRKCKLVTSGPWWAVGPTPIIDISVQPVGEGESDAIHNAVWAVGANGDALCRLGVSRKYPQGDSWRHVPADQPFVAVSMGGNCWVWGLAGDGSVWFRSGVTHIKPAGTAWLQVVPPPPGGCTLTQISVGKQNVWAVDANKILWRRRQTTLTFPEGTNWDMVSKHVQMVSVGPDDQVWAVRDSVVTKRGSVNGVISRRTGISESKPVGTGWEDGIGGGWHHLCVKGLDQDVNTRIEDEGRDDTT